jgi:hypothetical protein
MITSAIATCRNAILAPLTTDVAIRVPELAVTLQQRYFRAKY